MRNRLIALDLVLLGGIGFLGWQMRQTWLEARAREHRLAERQVPPQPAAPFSPLAPPQGASALSYLEVAQRLLFSKDRNPTVVIETPPPKQRPALPLAHGFMNFGEPQVILSEKSDTAQKIYKTGDMIGDFRIVGLTHDALELEWDGQRFSTPMAELRPKQAALEPAATPSAPAAAAPPQASVSTLTAPKSGPGQSMGGEQRACVPGDTAPAGTVQDGFKKVKLASPFGERCWWEPVK